jgi:hypothetical protein
MCSNLSNKLVLFILFLLLLNRAYSQEVNNQSQYPNIKPFGYTHLWALNDRTPGSSYGDDYQIARARIGAKGDLDADTNYMILTEWGRKTLTYPVTLLDAWVNFKINPAFNVKVGQTWYKFSLSGTTTLPTIPFVFRPEVVDAIWLPMGRNGSYSYDKGVELWGSVKESALPWDYAFFITTGTGIKRFADEKPPDFVGRVCVEPVKDFRAGVSGFYGWSRVEMISGLGRIDRENIPEYAYGTDISYNHKYFRVISEYLQALYEGYNEVDGVETFSIGTQKQRGWYTMFGFKPLSRLEIPIQYAWYEKNYVNSDTGLQTVTVGLTWFLKENTLNNIKINYQIRSAENNYGSKPRNRFITQVQLAF